MSALQADVDVKYSQGQGLSYRTIEDVFTIWNNRRLNERFVHTPACCSSPVVEGILGKSDPSPTQSGKDSPKDDTVHRSRTLCVLEIKLNRNERKEKRKSSKDELS